MFFSGDQSSRESASTPIHSAGFCRMISRGYGSDFQAAKYKVLNSALAIRSS